MRELGWTVLFGYDAPMFDPQMELLFTVLRELLAATPVGSGAENWGSAQAALAACGGDEGELGLALELEDEGELRTILDDWTSGKEHLFLHDRDVLKRALKAYRKRLKVTLLDDQSSLGGGPFSGGRTSDIVGITPPERYPAAVWEELARQERLVHCGLGTYELPPGG